MSLLIGIFLWLKGLALLVGSMVMTSDGAPVSLSVSQIAMRGDTAWISLQVDSLYSKELNDILDSGTPVPLIVESVFLKGEEIIAKSQVKNQLQFDLEHSEWILTRSNVTDRIREKKKVKKMFRNFDIALFTKSQIEDGRACRVTVSASLGTVRLDVLNMQSFDLMSLWNYKIPRLETVSFTKKEFGL